MKDGAGLFPEGRYGALVRASIFPTSVAENWQAYRLALADNGPNLGETRLFPMVASIAKRAGVQLKDQMVSAAQRSAHVRNEINLRAAQQVKDIFEQSDVSMVFLKGLALQITIYRDDTRRTSSDIDICIQLNDVKRVQVLAREQGWINTKNFAPQNSLVAEAHIEMTFQLPSGVILDVHWTPRQAFTYQPALIKNFFASTRMVNWRGTQWRVPSDSWMLIETIEHGLFHNEVVPTRWMTDAIWLLRDPKTCVDWEFVVDVAKRTKLDLIFKLGLTTLNQIDPIVPEHVLAQLPAPRGRLQRWELEGRLRPGRGPIRRIKRDFLHFFQRAPGNMVQRLWRFPSYLIHGAGRSDSLRALLWRVARQWHKI